MPSARQACAPGQCVLSEHAREPAPPPDTITSHRGFTPGTGAGQLAQQSSSAPELCPPSTCSFSDETPAFL